MANVKIGTRFEDDLLERLKKKEFAIEYFKQTLEDNDPGYADRLIVSLRRISQAYGITKLTKEIGVSPKSLYGSLKEGANPSLLTVLLILDKVGIRLTVAEPRRRTRAKRVIKRKARAA